MSGGSYDYFYLKLEGFTGEMRAHTPMRKMLREHLLKLGEVCRLIEWVDSGDSGEEDLEVECRKVFGEAYAPMVLQQLIREAEEVRKALEKMIEEVKGGGT